MCSGRVDIAFVLRAFASGVDGVFIGGCYLGECHYITHGNYHALAMVKLCWKLMERIGLRPERLRVEWVSAGEGVRFAEIMTGFSRQVRALGPVGRGEGIDPDTLRANLEALLAIAPYLRLVLRERLSPGPGTQEDFDRFFEHEDVARILEEAVFERWTAARLALLLRGRGPLPTAEIAQRLGLTASEASRHLAAAATRGMVRYDRAAGRYALPEM